MFDSPNSPYNNFGHSEDELSALRDYLTTVDEYGNLKADNQQQENIFEVPKTDDIPKKPFKIMSVYSRHSRGGIEEIRERTYDGRTGKTHESHTRRIGDRWFRNDTVTDEDGEKKAKEVWHNVSANEVLDFKDEWVARRSVLPHTEGDCLMESK